MARSPLEWRIWAFYTEEEKSLTILNAYKHRYLLADDIKSFLFKDRLNVWTTWAFPAVTFGAIYSFGLLNSRIAYRYPKSYQIAIPALVSVGLWFLWVQANPFQSALNKEKEKLLDLLDTRIGVNMKTFNDMVPRTWTTQEIHRKTRELYNDRHGLFTDILYPGEQAQAPLADVSTYPFKNRRDKIVK